MAALVRTVSVRPDRKAADAQLAQFATVLRHPKAVARPETTPEDPSVHAGPAGAPVPDRLHESVGPAEQGDGPPNRCRGHLPEPAAVLRLVGAVPLEPHDEWIAALRRYFCLESMAKWELVRGSILALPTVL